FVRRSSPSDCLQGPAQRSLLMRCVAMASRGPLKPDTTDAGQALASRLWALGPPRANVTRGGPKESKEEPRRIRAAELEIQADSEVYLAHPADRRGSSKERRGQRTAVPEIVGLVGEILRLHEYHEAVPRASLIERPHLRSTAAAKDADARWQRRRVAADRKLIPHHQIDGGLRVRAQRVPSDGGRPIVEHTVAVVVATVQKRVGSRRVRVDVQ